MTISKDEVLELMCAFHDVVMLDKGDAAPQGEFFLYRDPLIFIPPTVRIFPCGRTIKSTKGSRTKSTSRWTLGR